jgi:hypothetical protein
MIRVRYRVQGARSKAVQKAIGFDYHFNLEPCALNLEPFFRRYCAYFSRID